MVGCHVTTTKLNKWKSKIGGGVGVAVAVVVICTIISYVFFHPLFIACTCPLSSLTLFIFTVGGMYA